MNNPAVQFAQRKILEIGVPLHLLGVAQDQPLHFQLAVANKNAAPDLIPLEGWIEATDGSSTC